MDLAVIPKTAINSIIKNGKIIAPIAVAGLAALALVDVVKAVRN